MQVEPIRQLRELSVFRKNVNGPTWAKGSELRIARLPKLRWVNTAVHYTFFE